MVKEPSPLVIRHTPPVCYKRECTFGEGELRFQPLLEKRTAGKLWACPQCGDLYGPYKYMEEIYGAP